MYAAFKRNKEGLTRVVFLLFCAVIVSITGINSMGYHHADEHYQIIEFANYFLGNVSALDLSWEFDAQIRPSIQPILAASFIKLSYLIGVSDPFTILLMLRVLTGFFAVWVYTGLIKHMCRDNSIDTVFQGILAIAFACLLWFLPYLLVRFSSENFSSLFFILGMLPVLKEKNQKKAIVGAGFLLGLSISFRFQMGLCVFGLFLWLVFIRKMARSKLLFLTIGGLGAFFLLMICDFWFYGEWVCTPFNYLMKNVIRADHSQFGTAPWWSYLSDLWVYLNPVTLLFLLLGILSMFSKHRNHVLWWIVIPFITVHSLIDHKEFRFLFPIVFVVPWILMECARRLLGTKQQSIAYLVMFTFISANLTGAILISKKSAGTGLIGLLQSVHVSHNEDEAVIVHFGYCNPYEPWKGGNHANWYHNARRNINTKSIDRFSQIDSVTSSNSGSQYLFVRQMDFDYHGIKLNDFANKYQLLKSSHDSILLKVGVWFGMINPQEVYYSFKL